MTHARSLLQLTVSSPLSIPNGETESKEALLSSPF